MRIYIAGKMQGLPHFNFPLFHAVTKHLRGQGHEVFNPAERDEEQYGKEVSASETGDLKDTKEIGFNLNEALEADMVWICRHAEAVALLPGWETSKGANAEKALAHALGVQVFYVVPDDVGNYSLFKDYVKAQSLTK